MPLPELPELEELYRLYRADLYRYLCHLTHDPAEAEDLLSETFLRALKRLQPTVGTALSRPGCSALRATSGWKAYAKSTPPPAPMTCWKAAWPRTP